MKTTKNILVISFTFPPSPGVGGRRWLKFIKYLSKIEGYNIFTISSEFHTKSINKIVNKEIKEINFEHLTLPTKYPKYLERVELQKNNLINKLMFKIQHYFIKKNIKGNYWDPSVYWDSYFRSTIPELIKKEKITKVVISGPPFRYMKYATELKVLFPKLELIIDIRDPWNWYAINDPQKFGKVRNDFEINLEKEVLKKVDKVFTVSEFQKSLIFETEPQSAPIYVIPNGYDKDDYLNTIEAKEKSSKINLTHFGTLHQQKDYYWIPFFSAFLKLKNEHPELHNLIEINLVGYTPSEISKFIKLHKLNVKTHGILPPKMAYNLLNQADVALWFKYDNSSGDFATKFGDYVALNKYIWTFTVKGAVSELIEKEKIGKIFYRSNKDLENHIFNEFLKLENKNNRIFNPNYNSSQLDIEYITKDILTKALNDPA